ncbi:NAD(P)H-binding protein [Streptomyces sp. Q6]|uniref:NAD(P)H-binding protein n=1 Tax=Streptomyces citrinus TaxID=3118173 RepID=A0ACD5AUH4_9ACTN
MVAGDLTDAGSLGAAVEGVDAVVFTHGSHGGPGQAEHIDHGGVRNTLAALGNHPARIALMTAIGVPGRQVLVTALTSPDADHKTLEPVAVHAPCPSPPRTGRHRTPKPRTTTTTPHGRDPHVREDHRQGRRHHRREQRPRRRDRPAPVHAGCRDRARRPPPGPP